MTLRIDRQASGGAVVVRLIGNLRAEDIEEVRTEVVAVPGQVVLDIRELAIVGVEGIRFLNTCREHGMRIVNASPYICEWMLLERASGPPRRQS